MKNTFLKKASAAVLAAVMAVTFAPVASLQAFANSGVNDKNEINAATATITDSSVSVYKATTKSAITITNVSNPRKTITIDANGNDVSVSLNDGNAKVVITNSKNVSEFNQGAIPTVNYTVNTGKSLTLSGDYQLAGGVTSGQGIVAYAAPVATEAGIAYVGNKAINAANNYATGGNDIVAIHGAVVVNKLAEGKFASVDDSADKGTTIKVAAAEDDVTLQTLTTTYKFSYVSDKDLLRGVKGSYVSGIGTYVDTRYYAGNDAKFVNGNNAALTADADDKNNQAAIVTTGAILFRSTGVGYKYIADKTNGDVTIYTKNDSDATPLTAFTAIKYTIAKDITGNKNYKIPDTPANTYYSFDPKDYVDAEKVFGVIDGEKYRVADEDNALLGGVEPDKSLKLLQTVEYTKADGNKDAVAVIAYMNPEITLEAADDLSIATRTQKHVVGTTTYYTNNAIFFGKDKFGDKAVKEAFQGANKDVSSASVNVAQVAKNADSTFTFEDVPVVTSVSHADGIGYYRTGQSSNDRKGKYNFTFGTTKVVTDKFVENAQGKTSDGITANPEFRDGTVYASKEIKTTVKDVNADVTFLGEISAVATATDVKTGKKTWEINLADTATNDKAVVAYRLYDGNRGEHIYTYNANERDMLVKAGWKEELSDIKVLPVDAKTGVTVYRVYNPNNGGAHVFTTNPAEVKMLLDAGWEEGVAVFKTPAAGTANTLPVYRVYNTGSKNGEHQFTTSAAEKDNLVNHGWKLEGTPWYSFK